MSGRPAARALLVALGLLGLLLLGAPGVRSQADEAPAATPDQLAALAAILDRPEFRASEGRTALDQLLDPARDRLRWLAEQILRALVRASRAGGDAVPVGIAVMGLAIVLVAAFVLRRLLRGTVAANAEVVGGRLAGPPRAADERDRARAFAADGRYRRAVHHLYRAVLLRLDERDHLPFDGALTNRELVPRLAAAPELAAPFAELVARFDQLWYGQSDCSAAEHAAFAALAERVWQAADTVPPARGESRAAVLGVTARVGARPGGAS